MIKRQLVNSAIKIILSSKQVRLGLGLFFLAFFSLFNFSISSHGFHKDTIISCVNSYCKKTIFQMIEEAEKKDLHTVASYYARETKWYHFNKRKWVGKNIKAGGYSRTPVHCVLSFNVPGSPSKLFTVTCTPIQNFYRIPDNAWVPVCKLNIGDLLLAQEDKHIRLAGIKVVQEPLDVYTIQIKDTHVFLVTEYGLVAHNCFVPIGVFASLSIPVGMCEGGVAGVAFGPIGFTCGAVIGGLIGVAIKACIQDRVAEYSFSCGGPNMPSESLPCGTSKVPEYSLLCEESAMAPKYSFSCDGLNVDNFVLKNESAAEGTKSQGKAPGKPTENDGFIPKKNSNGEMVKHPKTGQYGWKDEKNKIWVPSGANGHGGPHWDVQYPDGKTYDNVLPGGKIRGQK